MKDPKRKEEIRVRQKKYYDEKGKLEKEIIFQEGDIII